MRPVWRSWRRDVRTVRLQAVPGDHRGRCLRRLRHDVGDRSGSGGRGLMAVTATHGAGIQSVTATHVIRPPDPAFDRGLPPRVGRYSSALATRILLHCYGRDVSTVLDLTYAAGGCWRWPVPADLTVVPNNWDPRADTPYHRDYTDNGFADRSWPGV